MNKAHSNGLNAWLLTVLAAAVCFCPPLPSKAATRTVTSLADNGPGSLRELIATSVAGDVIEFVTPGTISLGSQLTIERNIRLQGPGPDRLAISGGDVSRVFYLTASASAEISGLTISHGRAQATGLDANGNGASAYGGGILNEGSLVLSNCVLIDNVAAGVDGLDGSPGAGGGSADGGGIFQAGQSCLLLRCAVRNNKALGGRGGLRDDEAGGAGGPASGGGLGGPYFGGVDVGVLSYVLQDCTVDNNIARGGDGGAGRTSQPIGGNGRPGGGGGSVRGGGAFGLGLIAFGCTFSGNSSVGGAGGAGGSTPAGHGGNGGSGGYSIGGGVDFGFTDGYCGQLVNCTLSGNASVGGGGGNGGLSDGAGGYGAEARGGGLGMNRDCAILTNCTITLNQARGGSGGLAPNGVRTSAGVGNGGGVYSDLEHGFITGTLVAGNAAWGRSSECNDTSDYVGEFRSAGYNLVGDASCRLFNRVIIQNTDQLGGLNGPPVLIDARLGPLQDNGGPTWTHALLPGSPALDAGKSSLPTDQRGGVRSFDKAIPNASGGDGSDIGAFESGGFCRILSVTNAANLVHVSFTTDLGSSYSLQSRDIAASGAWTAIGSAQLGSGGILEAADARPFATERLYRIQVADPPTQLVYANGFEGIMGGEWSVPEAISTTPVGGRKFLGEFASAVATLQLANLPAHTHLSISFDLFILKSWDGNRTDFGPDRWTLSLRGGATLVDTTFTLDPAGTQAYPGAFGASYPGLTGAAEHNTLGYSFGGGPADSVYRLTATFHHTAGSVILDFSGVNLQEIADESWGLDNVRVEAMTLP